MINERLLLNSHKLWLFLVIIAFISLLYWSIKDRQTEDLLALTQILNEAESSETVSLNGDIYEVNSGKIVSDTELTPYEQLEILRLAYAKTYLRQEPILALPKTDLIKFDSALTGLEIAKTELSQLQTSVINKFLVKNFLYPSDYLNDLLATEKHRRQFLSSGHKLDLDKYIKSLQQTSQQYQKANFWYQRAFAWLIDSSSVRYATAQHLVDRNNSLATFKNINQAYLLADNKIQKFASCINVSAKYCSHFSDRPSLEVADNKPRTNQDSLEFTKDLYAKLQQQDTLEAVDWSLVDNPLVEINDSQCLGNKDSQILAMTPTKEALFEISDVRLIKTSDFATVPFYKYFFDRDIKYVPLNPLSHYACLRLNQDISLVYLIDEIKSVAISQPLSRETTNMELKSALEKIEADFNESVITENQAREYINLANSLDLPMAIKNNVNEFNLSFLNKSAKTEKLITRIAKSEISNISAYQKDLPVNLEAKHLFFSRSGFVALSTIGTGLDLPDSDFFEPFNSTTRATPYVYLSDLLETGLSLQELAADIYQYNALHY